MNKIIALLLIAFLAPLARAEENAVTWLKGTWKSNRELSIPTLKTNKPITPELRAKLENVFGKMTQEFTGSEMTARRTARAALLPPVRARRRKALGNVGPRRLEQAKPGAPNATLCQKCGPRSEPKRTPRSAALTCNAGRRASWA
jgi:hypothetical protein